MRASSFWVTCLAVASVGCAIGEGQPQPGASEEAIMATPEPLEAVRQAALDALGNDASEFLAGLHLVDEVDGGFHLPVTAAYLDYPERCGELTTVTLEGDRWVGTFTDGGRECDRMVFTDETTGAPSVVRWQSASSDEAELRRLVGDCVFADSEIGQRDEKIARVVAAASRYPDLRFGRGIPYTHRYFGAGCSLVLRDGARQKLLAIQGDMLD